MLKLYLSDRFLVRQHNEYTNLYQVKAEVPQSSALGLVLYLLYTADWFTTGYIIITIFVYNIAIIAVHANPTTSSSNFCNTC